MKCLDDIDEISLWGNENSVNVSNIAIRLVRCTGRPTCKSDAEITEFVEKNGIMFLAYNDQVYKP